jgi:hypothetical protein
MTRPGALESKKTFHGLPYAPFAPELPEYPEEKAPRKDEGLLKINFGGVLLSHTVSRAVPSALKSLTSVFEMGTGVSSSLLPPKTLVHK